MTDRDPTFSSPERQSSTEPIDTPEALLAADALTAVARQRETDEDELQEDPRSAELRELVPQLVGVVLNQNPKPVITMREILITGFGESVSQPLYRAMRRIVAEDDRLQPKRHGDFAVRDRDSEDWIDPADIHRNVESVYQYARERGESTLTYKQAMEHLEAQGIFMTRPELGLFMEELKNDPRVRGVGHSYIGFVPVRRPVNSAGHYRPTELDAKIQDAGITTSVRSPYRRRP